MEVKIMFYGFTAVTFLIGIVMSLITAIQADWLGYAYWIFAVLTFAGTIWLLVKSHGKL